MKHGRQLKKEKPLVASRGSRAATGSSRRKFPSEHGDLIGWAKRSKPERNQLADHLSKMAEFQIRRHLDPRLSKIVPFLWHDDLVEEELGSIIACAHIPPVGHASSLQPDWLTPPDEQTWIVSLFGSDAPVFKRAWQDDTVKAATFFMEERYSFARDGALVREASIDCTEGEAFAPCQAAPCRVRLPNERRALSVEEAWGAMAALARAFLAIRPSVTHIADAQVLDPMDTLVRTLKDAAQQIRAPELFVLRQRNSEVVEAICEGFVSDICKLKSQLSGAKQKKPLVSFMGPCVACFELLFGQPATPGGDCEPSPFTLFVVAFLAEFNVPCSWRSVRTYLHKWRVRPD